MKPIQPIYKDHSGFYRFRENAIVKYLLDKGGIDLNAIARMDFTDEDREQFAQLIGYSLHGFAELSYVSNATYETVYRMAEEGETQEQAQIRHLESLVDTVRGPARDIAAMLFRIHPNDLHT
jgi:hypothetical protein